MKYANLEEAELFKKQILTKGTIQERAIVLADHLLLEFGDLVFEKENIEKWVTEIYKVIHSANIYSTCYDVHNDWREETRIKLNKRLISTTTTTPESQGLVEKSYDYELDN